MTWAKSRVVVVSLVMSVGGLTSCAGLWSSAIPVPALDADRLRSSDVRRGTLSSQVRIRARLGDPVRVEPGADGGRQEWYPIRYREERGLGMLVPAARFEIRFDLRGVVRSAQYVHPLTGTILAVTEDSIQAERQARRDLWTAGGRLPRLAIASVHVDESTQRDVERWLLPLEDRLGARWPVFRRRTSPDGEIWEVFAERPSRILIPPFFYEAFYDSAGNLRFGAFQGYGSTL